MDKFLIKRPLPNPQNELAFFGFSDFFLSRSFIFEDWQSTAKTAKITWYFRGHVIFAVGRFCRIVDAGTEHSTSTLLFYCRNEKTAVSISLVIDYTSTCLPKVRNMCNIIARGKIWNHHKSGDFCENTAHAYKTKQREIMIDPNFPETCDALNG